MIAYGQIEKIVNEIRMRFDSRRSDLYEEVNKRVDIYEKCGIIRVDKRDRSHPKKKPQDRAKDVEFREVDDHTIAIKDGEAVGGNPYIITAMNGGDPGNPEDVKNTKKSLSGGGGNKRPEPELSSDLVAGQFRPPDAPLKNSKYGENVYCTGFGSKKRLDEHIEDHLKRGEFGDITKEEYVANGVKFCASACIGEDIDGDETVGYMYSDRDGNDIVVRYNPKTGEYAKGIPGWKLITYFKPKWKTGEGTFDRKGSEKYYMENRKKDIGR